MPLAKNRELIAVSSQAHKHLKAVVTAMKDRGLPTSGTMVVSELILSMPIPQPAPMAAAGVNKRKARPQSTAAGVAL